MGQKSVLSFTVLDAAVNSASRAIKDELTTADCDYVFI